MVVTACTKRKGKERGPAREVYKGAVRNLFYLAEEMGFECYVLSAKYGLISCEDEIEPYDVYLNELGEREREELKRSVESSCSALRGPWDVAIFHLSSNYASLLSCYIEAERALIIGSRPPNLVSGREVVYRYKTLGERNKILKEARRYLEELLQG